MRGEAVRFARGGDDLIEVVWASNGGGQCVDDGCVWRSREGKKAIYETPISVDGHFDSAFRTAHLC